MKPCNRGPNDRPVHYGVYNQLWTGTALQTHYALNHAACMSAPCHVTVVNNELPKQGASGTEPDEQVGRGGPAVTQHQTAEAAAFEERALQATGTSRRELHSP